MLRDIGEERLALDPVTQYLIKSIDLITQNQDIKERKHNYLMYLSDGNFAKPLAGSLLIMDQERD